MSKDLRLFFNGIGGANRFFEPKTKQQSWEEASWHLATLLQHKEKVKKVQSKSLPQGARQLLANSASGARRKASIQHGSAGTAVFNLWSWLSTFPLAKRPTKFTSRSPEGCNQRCWISKKTSMLWRCPGFDPTNLRRLVVCLTACWVLRSTCSQIQDLVNKIQGLWSSHAPLSKCIKCYMRMNTSSDSVNHGYQLQKYPSIQTAYVYTTLPCLKQTSSCYRIYIYV